MKKALFTLGIALLAYLISSCTQHDAVSPRGSWRLQSNTVDLEFMGVGEVSYLRFDDARPLVYAFGREAAVALKGCATEHVEVQSALLVFWPSDLYGGQPFEYAIDGDTLTLTDSEGRTAVFERVAEVPASERCDSLEATSSLPLSLPVDRAYGSNLLSDGSQLWIVGEDGKAYPIDPTTASVGAGQTLATGQYYHAVAAQNGDFWAHCQCGGSEDIKRMRLGGTEIDSVDTATDLGNEIRIRAGSWDGSRLWLWGRNRDSNRGELLRVNSNTEPDVLEDVLVFDTWTLRQLTHHDGKLWGLFRFAGWQLAELDPAAGRVTKSYVLPALEMNGQYIGIASLNGKLYLLASLDQGYALFAFQP